MSEKAKLLEMVKNNVNLSGMFVDLLDELLEPALQKVVDSTENPFDNMAMTTLYPVLEKEMKKLVAEKLDGLFSVE